MYDPYRRPDQRRRYADPMTPRPRGVLDSIAGTVAQEERVKAQAQAEQERESERSASNAAAMQERQAKEQERAAREAEAQRVREMAEKGAVTKTDVATGSRTIDMHHDGAPKFKVGPVGDPVKNGEKWTQTFRNDRGETQERDIASDPALHKIDEKTGEKYFEGKDDFGAPKRVTLGYDEQKKKAAEAKARLATDGAKLDLEWQNLIVADNDITQRKAPIQAKKEQIEELHKSHKASLKNIGVPENAEITRTDDGKLGYRHSSGAVIPFTDAQQAGVSAWKKRAEVLDAQRAEVEPQWQAIEQENQSLALAKSQVTAKKAQLEMDAIRAENPDLPDADALANDATAPTTAAKNAASLAAIHGPPAPEDVPTLLADQKDDTRPAIKEAAAIALDAHPLSTQNRIALEKLPPETKAKFTPLLQQADQTASALDAERAALDARWKNLAPAYLATGYRSGDGKEIGGDTMRGLSVLGIDAAATDEELQSKFSNNPDYWTAERQAGAMQMVTRARNASAVLAKEAPAFAEAQTAYAKKANEANAALSELRTQMGIDAFSESIDTAPDGDTAGTAGNIARAMGGDTIMRPTKDGGTIYDIVSGGRPIGSVEPDADKRPALYLDDTTAALRLDIGRTKGLPIYKQRGKAIPAAGFAEMVKKADALIAQADYGPQQQNLKTERLDMAGIVDRFNAGEISDTQANTMLKRYYGKTMGEMFPDSKKIGTQEDFDQWVQRNPEKTKHLDPSHKKTGAELDALADTYFADIAAKNTGNPWVTPKTLTRLRGELAGQDGSTVKAVMDTGVSAIGSTAGVIIGLAHTFNPTEYGAKVRELTMGGTMAQMRTVRRNAKGWMSEDGADHGMSALRDIGNILDNRENWTLNDDQTEQIKGLAKTISAKALKDKAGVGFTGGSFDYDLWNNPDGRAMLDRYIATGSGLNEIADWLRTDPDKRQVNKATAEFVGTSEQSNTLSGKLREAFMSGLVAPLPEKGVEIAGDIITLGATKAGTTALKVANQLGQGAKIARATSIGAKIGQEIKAARASLYFSPKPGIPLTAIQKGSNIAVTAGQAIAAGAITEGLEEVATVPFNTDDPKFADYWNNFTEGAIGGAFLGTIMLGGVGGVGKILDDAKRQKSALSAAQKFADDYKASTGQEITVPQAMGVSPMVRNKYERYFQLANRAAVVQNALTTGTPEQQAKAAQMVGQILPKLVTAEKIATAQTNLALEAITELAPLGEETVAAWQGIATVAAGGYPTEQQNAALGKLPGAPRVIETETVTPDGITVRKWEVTPEARAEAAQVSPSLGQMLANEESVILLDDQLAAEAAQYPAEPDYPTAQPISAETPQMPGNAPTSTPEGTLSQPAPIAPPQAAAPRQWSIAPVVELSNPLQTGVSALRRMREMFPGMEASTGVKLAVAKQKAIQQPDGQSLPQDVGGGMSYSVESNEISVYDEFHKVLSGMDGESADIHAETVIFEEVAHHAQFEAIYDKFRATGSTAERTSPEAVSFYRGEMVSIANEVKANNPALWSEAAQAYAQEKGATWGDDVQGVAEVARFIISQRQTGTAAEETLLSHKNYRAMPKFVEFITGIISKMKAWAGQSSISPRFDEFVAGTEAKIEFFRQSPAPANATAPQAQTLKPAVSNDTTAQLPGPTGTTADSLPAGPESTVTPRGVAQTTNQEKGEITNGQEPIPNERQIPNAGTKERQQEGQMLNQPEMPTVEQSTAADEAEFIPRDENAELVRYYDDEAAQPGIDFLERSDTAPEGERKAQVIYSETKKGDFKSRIQVYADATPVDIAEARAQAWVLRNLRSNDSAQNLDEANVETWLKGFDAIAGTKIAPARPSAAAESIYPDLLSYSWRDLAAAQFALHGHKSTFTSTKAPPENLDANPLVQALRRYESSPEADPQFLKTLADSTGTNDEETSSRLIDKANRDAMEEYSGGLSKPIHERFTGILRSHGHKLPTPEDAKKMGLPWVGALQKLAEREEYSQVVERKQKGRKVKQTVWTTKGKKLFATKKGEKTSDLMRVITALEQDGYDIQGGDPETILDAINSSHDDPIYSYGESGGSDTYGMTFYTPRPGGQETFPFDANYQDKYQPGFDFTAPQPAAQSAPQTEPQTANTLAPATPEFTLESATPEQIKADAAKAEEQRKKAEVKAKLEERKNKRLIAGELDTTGDMFDATKADNPLFATTAQMPETETAQAPTQATAQKNKTAIQWMFALRNGQFESANDWAEAVPPELAMEIVDIAVDERNAIDRQIKPRDGSKISAEEIDLLNQRRAYQTVVTSLVYRHGEIIQKMRQEKAAQPAPSPATPQPTATKLESKRPSTDELPDTAVTPIQETDFLNQEQATSELAKRGITIERDQTKNGNAVWRIKGKTFDVKDTLKGLGAKWYNPEKAWSIFSNEDPTQQIANAITGKQPADAKPRRATNDTGGADSSDNTGTSGNPDEDLRLRQLRARLDASADERGTRNDAISHVNTSTADLIRRGLKFGMPAQVVEDQIEDIAMITRAYGAGKTMFLLGNGAGTGKTFVLGGAIRELKASGAKDFFYVTMNTDLIAQIKKDLADYGIGDVSFHTYSELSGKGVYMPDNAVLIFDEAHNVKNAASSRGGKAQPMMAQAKFTIFASATPFENPVEAAYLAGTGIFNQAGGHVEWGKAYGANVRKYKIMTPRGMEEKEALYWTGGKLEDGLAARQWFVRQGIMVTRPMQLPMHMVESQFTKKHVSQEFVDIYNQVMAAYDSAMSAFRDDDGNILDSRNNSMVSMHQTNTIKRILEAAKIDQAVEEAKNILSTGGNVVIFVETKADRNIGKYRASEFYEKASRLYSYPEIQSIMSDWNIEAGMARMMNDAKPPRPFSEPIVQIARAMYEAGIDMELPSVEDQIVQKLGGKEAVAVYTGSVSNSSAFKDKEAFLSGKKRVIVATMAKGGTGLSLHDKVGNRQTWQININLPWKATGVDQVSGRVARYGLQSKASINWLFADNIPFERMLASRVGRRMRDMGALVKGIDMKAAKVLTDDFDFQGSADVKQAEGEITTSEPDIWETAARLEKSRTKAADTSHGFFETPLPIAALISEITGSKGKLLEPSAGRGNLIRFAKGKAKSITAIELRQDNASYLAQFGSDVQIIQQDFMEWSGEMLFDTIHMNPPFERIAGVGAQDVAHVMKAFKLLAPGGRLAAIMGEGAFFRNYQQEKDFRQWLNDKGAIVVKLPEGAFKNSGTGVRTRMVVLDQSAAPGRTDMDLEDMDQESLQYVAEAIPSRASVSKFSVPEKAAKRLPAENVAAVRAALDAAGYQFAKVIHDPAIPWEARFTNGRVEINAAHVAPEDAAFKAEHEIGHALWKEAGFRGQFERLWNALSPEQQKAIDATVEDLYADATDAVKFEEKRVRALEAIRREAAKTPEGKSAWQKFLNWLVTSIRKLTQSQAVSDPEAIQKLAAAMVEVGRKIVSGNLVREISPGVYLAYSAAMVDMGGGKFSIRAYHGTPHKVGPEGFTLSKIGTGEGAQAYGWGLYFAEEQKVAAGYRDALSGIRLLDATGKSIMNATNNPVSAKILKEAQYFWKNGETTVPSIIQNIKSQRAQAEFWAKDGANIESNQAFVIGADEAIRILQGGAVAKVDGNLYTVELLAESEDFLDWDKPLSEQAEIAKRLGIPLRDVDAEVALLKRARDLGVNPETLPEYAVQVAALDDLRRNKLGLEIYQDLSESETPEQTSVDGNGWGAMQYAYMGPQKASEFLLSKGIRGIRYLDGNSRNADEYRVEWVGHPEETSRLVNKKDAEKLADLWRGWGREVTVSYTGSYNYVIFDESIIKILEENGEARYSMASQNAPQNSGSRISQVNLPPALIAHPLATITNHTAYAAAKSGNVKAAIAIAQALIKTDFLSEIRTSIGSKKPIVVPVMAEESGGRNRIPLACAKFIAKRLGLPIARRIMQSNRANRTNLSALDRVFSQATFTGPVEKNADYILVDDTLTQGGTFASLAAHIRAYGGNPIAAIALTGKNYSATLSQSDESLTQLRSHLGDLEPAFRDATGYGFDALTASETRALIAWRPVDAVRTRIIAEGHGRSGSRDGRSVEGSGADALTGGVKARDAASPSILFTPGPNAPASEPTEDAVARALSTLTPLMKKVWKDLLSEKNVDQVARMNGISPTGVENIIRIVRGKALALQSAKDNTPPPSKDGMLTNGRPDLALSTIPAVASIDAARNTEGSPSWRPRDMVIDEAKRRLKTDYAGTFKSLLYKAQNLEPMSDTDVAAVKLIIAEEAAQGSLDNAARRMDLAELIFGYREIGSETARSLAMRFDPWHNPAERAAAFLAEAMLSPDPATAKSVRSAKTAAERQAILQHWMKRVDGIKTSLKAAGIDTDALLAEHKAVQDRITSIDAANPESARLYKIQISKISPQDRAILETARALQIAGQKDMKLVMTRAASAGGVAVEYAVSRYRAFQAELAKEMRGVRDQTVKLVFNTPGVSSYEMALLDEIGFGSLDEFFDENNRPKTQRKKKSKEKEKAKDAKPSGASEEKPAGPKPTGPKPKPTAPKPAPKTRPVIPAALNPTIPPTGYQVQRVLGVEGPPTSGNGTMQGDGRGTGALPLEDPNSIAGTGEIPLSGMRDRVLGPVNETTGTGETPISGIRDNVLGPVNETTGDGQSLSQIRDSVLGSINETVGTYDLTDPKTLELLANNFGMARGTWIDGLAEFWKASILSGPKTQVVNIVSTAAYGAYETVIRRAGEAVVNSALKPFGISDKNSASIGELAVIFQHVRQAVAHAYRNGLVAWQTERRVYNDQVKALPMQLDFTAVKGEKAMRYKANPNTNIGKVVNLLMTAVHLPSFRLMGMADEILKTFFGHLEASAQAHRIAKAEGVTGDAYKVRHAELMVYGSKAWIKAHDKGLKISFQQEIGTGNDSISKSIDWLGLSAQQAVKFMPAMQFVIPFISTPINLYKSAIELSPAGAFFHMIDGIRALRARYGKDGDIPEIVRKEASQAIYNQSRFIADLTQQIIAWSVGYALIGMADDDEDDGLPRLTGTAPARGTVSRGTRDLADRTMPPMHIKIGGAWIDYSRLDPLATVLSSVADYAHAKRQNKEGAELASVMFSKLLAATKDKTFLSGIGDLMYAYEDGVANKSGGYGLESYISRIATGFVPNLIRQPIQMADEYRRDTKEIPADLSFSENMAIRVGHAMVPSSAPIKLDIWGRPMLKTRVKLIGPQTDTLLRIFWPGGITADAASQVTPIDKWILAYERTKGDGDPSLAFEIPDRNISYTINGKRVTVTMTPEDHAALIRNTGKAALSALRGNDAAAWADWKKPIPAKAKMIKDVMEDLREANREIMRAKYMPQAMKKIDV